MVRIYNEVIFSLYCLFKSKNKGQTDPIDSAEEYLIYIIGVNQFSIMMFLLKDLELWGYKVILVAIFILLSMCKLNAFQSGLLEKRGGSQGYLLYLFKLGYKRSVWRIGAVVLYLLFTLILLISIP